MMGTLLFGTTVSCQKQGEVVQPNVQNATPNLDEEKLTTEEENFLAELDIMIAEEIKKAEKIDTKAKGNNTIDPSNPNNPYEYVGEQVNQMFACATPHIKEAIDGNVNECPSKINNECSKTGDCVCDGAEENLQKLFIKCAENISNSNIDYKQYDYGISTFSKKVFGMYLKNISNKQNINAIINVSKGFENHINNSNIITQQEKVILVSHITSNKYTLSIIHDNQGNNGPLEWPTLDGVLGCVDDFADSDAGGAILVVGFATGNGGYVLLGLAIGCTAAAW